MLAATFVPTRAFLGTRIISRSTTAISISPPGSRSLTCATLSARDRRRALEHARTLAHKQLKRELDHSSSQLLSAVVSVPSHVRERCKLTSRMARVKVFLEKHDISDISVFRGRVRSGLVRLFPELEDRALLRAVDGFDLRVGGGAVVQDSQTLQKGLERCEKAGAAVYVEVIPHNVPPPKPPLSERVRAVRQKAIRAEADPSSKLQMISFYKFVGISRPDILGSILEKVWSRMGVKGRVYVATEGINAQLAVPEVVLADFRDAMNGTWMERGESLIPVEVVNVFLNMDSIVHYSEQPFEKLSVKRRDKILADGFETPLDWNKSGREVPPQEWHNALKENPEDLIVLDCRNNYESSVGKFDGADPLDTTTFRESWDKLDTMLQNENREKRILTYCTGGIRCVKVNAYLEQKLGFKNTGRLQGGIVSYARELRNDGKLDESLFKGVNHVFDGRMGEVITEDLLERCINCNQPCNVQTDCANIECPRPFDKRMFVQCAECAKRMDGACCAECQQVIRSSGILPEISSKPAEKSTSVRDYTDNDRYADSFSSPEPPLLQDLRKRTEELFPSRCHMLSGHSQVSLLRLLIQTLGGTRVLEIGTFTGYATLGMASALPSSGHLDTCELDDEVASVAEEYFRRDENNGSKIVFHRGKAIDTLKRMMEHGTAPYDLAFVDADKGGYERYMNFLLENGLIRVGGLMVFDNVLFRGEVSKLWTDSSSIMDEEVQDSELARKRLRNLQNVRRTATKLHKFNGIVCRDQRVEQVMLPMRDGLTIARRIQ